MYTFPGLFLLLLFLSTNSKGLLGFLSFLTIRPRRALDCLESLLAECDNFLHPDPDGDFISPAWHLAGFVQKKVSLGTISCGILDDVSWEASILGTKGAKPEHRC